MDSLVFTVKVFLCALLVTKMEVEVALEEEYVKIPLRNVIDIDNIVTVYYFEFAKDYMFQGEKHNFWELVYIDKGEVEILAGSQGYILKQGDIVFHKPNEFHSILANGKIAPNILIVTFSSDSPGMKYFENKILKLSSKKLNLLSEIINETKYLFSNNIGKPYKALEKKPASLYGSEQMLKMYLEMFLIQLIREGNYIDKKERISFVTKEKMDNDIVDNIISYLKENTDKNYTFEDICDMFSIGRTHLKIIFKNKMGQGVMTYFSKLKIEEAKKMIREDEHNFTEISELLGYKSVHYFSRTFRKFTNMSPSEYASSVKVRANI
jgi:AraC-like DNA-binding protein/quercetin dioxygenase-like cupin family protein